MIKIAQLLLLVATTLCFGSCSDNEPAAEMSPYAMDLFYSGATVEVFINGIPAKKGEGHESWIKKPISLFLTEGSNAIKIVYTSILSNEEVKPAVSVSIYKMERSQSKEITWKTLIEKESDLFVGSEIIAVFEIESRH